MHVSRPNLALMASWAWNSLVLKMARSRCSRPQRGAWLGSAPSFCFLESEGVWPTAESPPPPAGGGALVDCSPRPEKPVPRAPSSPLPTPTTPPPPPRLPCWEKGLRETFVTLRGGAPLVLSEVSADAAGGEKSP